MLSLRPPRPASAWIQQSKADRAAEKQEERVEEITEKEDMPRVQVHVYFEMLWIYTLVCAFGLKMQCNACNAMHASASEALVNDMMLGMLGCLEVLGMDHAFVSLSVSC